MVLWLCTSRRPRLWLCAASLSDKEGVVAGVTSIFAELRRGILYPHHVYSVRSHGYVQVIMYTSTSVVLPHGCLSIAQQARYSFRIDDDPYTIICNHDHDTVLAIDSDSICPEWRSHACTVTRALRS
ncbi:hypothetical protein PENSPDRAFT_20317 [Peniophora sp. CONT]|nr:hypothetical protein PENSPDRAFT_20317 [Peniophora sp. CONT]